MNQLVNLNFEDFYQKLLIGQGVKLKHGSVFVEGVIMDKYLYDDNVCADILLSNFQVLEKQAFFLGEQQIILLIK